MKKTFNLFIMVNIASLFLLTSCNLKENDSPQDYLAVAVVKNSGYADYKDYLLLRGGTKLLPINAKLPNNIKDDDLVYVWFNVESEQEVNDTNQYQYKINIRNAITAPLIKVVESRLDTLGQGSLIAVDPYVLDNYLAVDFKAYGDQSHRYFIGKDSLPLVGSNGLMARDTLFLELRHREGNYTYAEVYRNIFLDLIKTARQRIDRDSITISLKYNDINSKTTYRYLRYKSSY